MGGATAFPGASASALKAAKQKTDFFGELMQRERESAVVPTVWSELREGKVPRLSTAQKFQAGVVITSLTFVWLFWSERKYFSNDIDQKVVT
mmetsp:Transcript_53416/g.121786  ORF Transcript_53416/g.121786 Transcript_53416/m.121786 type:complete len:92 (+) Transcript_53416:297-572(+)